MKMISLKIACLIVLTLTIHIVSSVSLIAAETLTWVYMANAEPESYEEDGIPKGVQPEIVNYLCGKLGIKVIHKFYPWARAQGIVKKGEADCMMTTPTGSRFKYAVFGKENVKPAFWNIFYNKNRADMAMKMKTLSKLDDLKQFKLLDFIGNGWTNAFMKKENGFNIHFVPRLGQIPTMLSKGRADLTINSTTMINWWAKKNNVIDKIEMYSIEWPWTRFHYVAMVSRKSPLGKKRSYSSIG